MQITNLKANSNVLLKQQKGLELRESKEAQCEVDSLLLACFSVQKMYGRQPENIEIMNQVFHNMLAEYLAYDVVKAMKLWMKRSDEFPTPSGIIGLIKRQGKPAPSRELYISASKKDYEDRTEKEKQLMRDYENEYNENEWGSDYKDSKNDNAFKQENISLRQQIKDLKEEIEKLANLLKIERIAKNIEKPKITDKITQTIDYMKSIGAIQSDIEDFIRSQQ